MPQAVLFSNPNATGDIESNQYVVAPQIRSGYVDITLSAGKSEVNIFDMIVVVKCSADGGQTWRTLHHHKSYRDIDSADLPMSTHMRFHMQEIAGKRLMLTGSLGQSSVNINAIASI